MKTSRHPIIKRTGILLVAMIHCVIALCAKPDIPNILSRLDKYVEDWEQYATRNDQALRQMEKSLATASPKRQVETYEKLVCEYRHVNVDSALRCIDGGRKLAREMGDSAYVQRFNILEYTVMPIYGLVKDAIDLYERLSVQTYIRPTRSCISTPATLYINMPPIFTGDRKTSNCTQISRNRASIRF